MKEHYCPVDKTVISYEGECNWCGEKENVVKIVGDEVKFLKLSDTDLINNIMEQGFFEAHVLKSAVELLKNIPNGVILDIGANMGSFTMPLAYYNPQFQFVCFEPQRMVCYQLCGNVAINKLQNVQVLNLALGEKEDTLLVETPDYNTETNIGAFSLDEEVRKHDDYLCKTKGMQQWVEVRKLDSIALENIRLIKIDVEGMELSVLKGAVETLSRNKYPPILFEAWSHKEWFLPRKQELIDWLTNIGYEVQSGGEDHIAVYKGERVE